MNTTKKTNLKKIPTHKVALFIGIIELFTVFIVELASKNLHSYTDILLLILMTTIIGGIPSILLIQIILKKKKLIVIKKKEITSFSFITIICIILLFLTISFTLQVLAKNINTSSIGITINATISTAIALVFITLIYNKIPYSQVKLSAKSNKKEFILEKIPFWCIIIGTFYEFLFVYGHLKGKLFILSMSSGISKTIFLYTLPLLIGYFSMFLVLQIYMIFTKKLAIKTLISLTTKNRS